MGGMSWIHWVIILAVLAGPAILASFVVPPARILMRAGFSPFWLLLGLIPVVGLIALWRFAFMPWPALDERRRAES